MRLHEFYDIGGAEIVRLARRIKTVWSAKPVSRENMKWLVELSKDKYSIGRLYAQTRKVNSRAIFDTDAIILDEAGDCAEAYIILNEVEQLVRRKQSTI